MGERTQNAEMPGEVVPFDRDSQNLAVIAAGAAGGDPGSILSLFDRFGPVINRLVWRLLGPDPEHSDVVHDVIVAVLESIGEVKNPSLLEQWICGVAVNTVRRELRRRKFFGLFHLVPNPDHDHTAPDGCGAHMALRRFYEALDGMPADDRNVFVLRFVEGFAPREIAAMCERPSYWVTRHLTRAREKFLKRAGEDFVLQLQKGTGP
jgi:RNA polymerase sigma-70 factor (ECF subfamily)